MKLNQIKTPVRDFIIRLMILLAIPVDVFIPIQLWLKIVIGFVICMIFLAVVTITEMRNYPQSVIEDNNVLKFLLASEELWRCVIIIAVMLLSMLIASRINNMIFTFILIVLMLEAIHFLNEAFAYWISSYFKDKLV